MKMLSNRTLLAVFFLLVTISTQAQELNIGLHASPIICVPILDKKSQATHPALRPQRTNINASGGLNINARFGKFCIETGVNTSSRSTVFKFKLDEYSYNNLNGSSSITSNSDVRALGYAWGIPLQVGFLLDHHQEQTTYDLFGILGTSYETHTANGFSYASTTVNNSSSPSVTTTNSTTPAQGFQSSWFNIIAGFKINAILLKVGLIEYGLRYHFPLSNAGLYDIRTSVGNGTYGSVFQGNFYPHLSYLDFHFTYYLINFKGGEGSKSYRR